MLTGAARTEQAAVGGQDDVLSGESVRLGQLGVSAAGLNWCLRGGRLRDKNDDEGCGSAKPECIHSRASYPRQRGRWLSACVGGGHSHNRRPVVQKRREEGDIGGRFEPAELAYREVAQVALRML